MEFIVSFLFLYGSSFERNSLQKYVKRVKQMNIIFHEFMPVGEIGNRINEISIGISWVPVNEIYQLHPVTKTVDYIVSGLKILATNNPFNMFELRGYGAGIIHEDTAEAFSIAYMKILEMNECDSTVTAEFVRKHSSAQVFERFKLYLWA